MKSLEGSEDTPLPPLNKKGKILFFQVWLCYPLLKLNMGTEVEYKKCTGPTFYWRIRLKYLLRLPHLLQNENVTQWEWWVFLKNLEDLPLNNMNLYLAQHALTMLALCYLPGCLAGYIQLFRGTKYSRFPKFLDRWLKMRKQLGLLMLLSASLHVISLF